MVISSEEILSFWFSESGKNWSLDWDSSKNPCESYVACGLFGVCKASESPICKCLKGFIPMSNEEWSKRNRTGGCVRRTNLFCQRHKIKSVVKRTKWVFEGAKIESTRLFNPVLHLQSHREENIAYRVSGFFQFGWSSFQIEINDAVAYLISDCDHEISCVKYYLEKNLDARERELEREAEIEEKAPKVRAKSKMSKAEKEARKKQKMQAFQQAKAKSKGTKNAKRWN